MIKWIRMVETGDMSRVVATYRRRGAERNHAPDIPCTSVADILAAAREPV